jgi:hypothetical protein
VLIGSVAGLAAVAPLTRLATTLLREISPFDSAIYAGTLALVVASTVGATYLAGTPRREHQPAGRSVRLGIGDLRTAYRPASTLALA